MKKGRKINVVPLLSWYKNSFKTPFYLVFLIFEYKFDKDNSDFIFQAQIVNISPSAFSFIFTGFYRDGKLLYQCTL